MGVTGSVRSHSNFTGRMGLNLPRFERENYRTNFHKGFIRVIQCWRGDSQES